MSADLAETVAQRERLYAEARERARGDLGFRERLIADPRDTLDALAKELGLSVGPPDGIDIRIIDGNWETLYLVLPPPEVAPLSATELDRVTGGGRLAGSATLQADAHGCPACPHPVVGPLIRR